MKILKCFFISSICTILSCSVISQVKLPRLIRDSMVLQRDIPVKIWGWATKNEKVKIIFNNKTYKATADTAGRWNTYLPATKAGGPYTITVSASNTITLKEVLFGDVWVCSGQSNMVHQMGIHNVRYEKEIAEANNSQIRHFWIPTLADVQKTHDDLPTGYWKSANPQDVLDFSAVAYFFALKIYEQYHVPIGLINASVGGTPIEAWISEDGYKDFPNIQSIIQKNKNPENNNRRGIGGGNLSRPRSEDRGMTEKWYSENYIPKGWHNIVVPGYWEDQGVKDLDGVVWYRKEINVPQSMVNKNARLFLGRIVDADNVYINGKAIGGFTYMYPQRRYNIASDILHEGKNIIVVKVQNNSGKGGFVPDKPYYLFSGKDTINLTGYWQYKVGEVYIPVQRGFGGGNGGGGPVNPQNQPAGLYNAMVAPIAGYTNKGFLWYQGESNTGKPFEYDKLQRTLIADWRNKWNNPEAPFLYVQLPGFLDMTYIPVESQQAQFRNQQAKTLDVPNTGMAVTIDLGEWNDIHPDRKKKLVKGWPYGLRN